MTRGCGAKWPRARRGNIGNNRGTFSHHAVEHCRRCGCNDRAARAGCADRALPNLLATDLRVPPPHRLRYTRRAGPDPGVFPTCPRKPDAAARLAREGAVPKFSSRRVEALPGSRANATAYVEARWRDAIYLNGRTSF